MKQEASQTFSKLLKQNNNIETLDGPPIDFSFKNIRALHQLPQNIPLPKTSTSPNELKDTNLATTFALTLLESPAISAAIKAGMSAKKGPADGDKDIQQVAEQKLQIVRTIESGDHNYLQSQHKKTTNQKQKKQKKLKKTVTPITTSLLLRYNKLTEIQDFIKFVSPIFPHSLDYLMWVDLSHNRITALSTDLGQLKNLKTLYLHVNYINNFKELQKLKKLALLRTLTIHANPLETYEQFRVLIHSILPTLKKIDSTLLTKRETERAEVLMKTMKKYPVIKNVQKEREESENQEDSDL